jgi:hypothetical protein
LTTTWEDGARGGKDDVVSKRRWCWKVAGLFLLAGVLLVLAPSPSAAAVLYAISGDGATPASTLYTLDLSSGSPNPVVALGNGDDGEGIAFGPDAATLLHSSGSIDGSEFLETVNPDSLTVGPNLAPAGTYGPDPVGELHSLGWYEPLGVFLATDNNFDFYHVSASGQFTQVGNSGVKMRGFAAVGAQVFGVSPSAQELYEVDPDDGAVLATLPLSVDDTGTTGNGLATHPDTGVVYAIVKNPASPSGGRLLATLDVTTGQATSIGDTGLKLAGITFRTHVPLYAISGDGASPSSTLYSLDLGNAAPTLAVTLGNGDDGEGISSRAGNALLYHTSGGSDGSEFFETVNPDTWAVGPNLVPSDTYGPDSAHEITAIAWYTALGVFLVSDQDFNFYHVTAGGQFTLVGNSGLQMRGFAVVGAQVFGASPFLHELYEVDPNNGAVLATLPLSVDAVGTTGNGLATSPDTGVVFAIVKNPISPSGGRLLAILDVTTGQATSIGNTGLKLADLTFPVPEPASWLMLVAGAALLALLYRRRTRGLQLR